MIMKTIFKKTLLVLSIGLLATSVFAADVKIGTLTILEGPFAILGEDGTRGINIALKEWKNKAGGKNIKIFKASSNGSPDSALKAVKKLVENDKVSIVIGPLSGSEGLAIKDYAKTQPHVTFINGTSAAQDTTLRNPAKNFFRFGGDGAQWVAGLGQYAYKEKGYRNIVVIGEDYSFPYTMAFGFLKDFCGLGGSVKGRHWVPIGNKDYSSIVASIPDDIDAIFVALGGSDAINFLSQYEQAGGDKPLIGGTITVDQSVLGSKGRRKDYIIGTPSASPMADNLESKDWQDWKASYKKQFPKGFPSPSLFAYYYYVATKAALTGLDKAKGDVSNNNKKLNRALTKLKLKTPTGVVTLDKNRQAIIDVFITEVAKDADGNLYNKVVKVVPKVDQVLNGNRKQFLALGKVGRDVPKCD